MRLADAPREQLTRTAYNVGAFNPSADEIRPIVLRGVSRRGDHLRGRRRSGRASSTPGRRTWTIRPRAATGASRRRTTSTARSRIPDSDHPEALPMNVARPARHDDRHRGDATRAGPTSSKPTTRAVPALGSGDVLIRGARRRRQPAGPDAAAGKYPPPPGASTSRASRWRASSSRSAPAVDALARRRSRHARSWPAAATRSTARRRRRSACRCPRGLDVEEAAGAARDVLHRLDQRVRAGRLQRGRDASSCTAARAASAPRPSSWRGRSARACSPRPVSPEKCAAFERLGAERAINYRDEDFVEVVKDSTGGRGVDVVLDMVGGDYVARNLEVAGDGRPARPDRVPARRAAPRST